MEHLDVNTTTLMQIILTLLGSLIASSGFWLFAAKKIERRSLSDSLLTGLAHDRIMHLGLAYIQRGSITQEEFENLQDCLYSPYEKMGGNGTAKRIMVTVHTLPIRRSRSSDPPIGDDASFISMRADLDKLRSTMDLHFGDPSRKGDSHNALDDE